VFNFIVSANEEAWERPTFVLDKDRFLEFTDEQLVKKFRALDDGARQILRGLPTLFAYEDFVGKSARVGTIRSIEKQGRQLGITYAFNPSVPPVDSDRVRRAAWDNFEMNRTHWAVKEGDLFDSVVGLASNVTTDTAGDQAPAKRTYSRATILAACEMLTALSHARFDRFLLEVGIDGLNAARDGGRSLAGRAKALAEFAMTNPAARTAEGELLDLRILRQAVELTPTVNDAARDGFLAALKRNGYELRGGEVVPFAYATVEGFDINAGLVRPSPPTPLTSVAPVAPASTPAPSRMRSTPSQDRAKVFLVHGRDDGAKHEVARFLERIGLEVIILHERPNGGRTIINKFQEEAAGVAFAVVLITPDDEGRLRGSPTALAPRARQNVVFELGFFVGKIEAKRVCALVSDEIEKPSDFESIVYVHYGPKTQWKTELARELHEAGVPFDASRLIGA
jgi:predicted nucleotide-binding protein